MSIAERPKAEIVARVLERIAEDRYHADGDENEELIIILDYGRTFLEREAWFLEQLGELEKLRDGPESQDSDLPLRENWSDDWSIETGKIESAKTVDGS